MFVNYLKVTLRNLARNAFFVIVNILAMSVAIVACLNHKYDADWDKSHTRAKEIYQVIFTRKIQGRQQPYGATPIPVGNFIAENISGILRSFPESNRIPAVRLARIVFGKGVCPAGRT